MIHFTFTVMDADIPLKKFPVSEYIFYFRYFLYSKTLIKTEQ
jgi:hypothetical protein